MIEVVAVGDRNVTMRATVRRVGVYLDNWAIISLAKEPGPLRERFIGCLKQGADLLFSRTNGMEVIGPAGESRTAVRRFLEEIGPYWIPIEGPAVVAVMEREARGVGPEACVANDLLHQFYAGRSIQLFGEQRHQFVGPEYFNLSFFLDWLVPQQDQISGSVSGFENRLAGQLKELRRAYEQHRQRFELLLPAPKYDRSRPATFCWNGLLRLLVLQGKAYQWKTGDAADFCHAIMAASYAQVVTLDKHWKRRMESLPKPNSLAAIYDVNGLVEFVADIERRLGAA